ncbi:unnamed protein product [Vitrella brassicaformis CCMP3155]|uniref:Uncharacterized protein n=2 Tax=Vitrella brassicaformis TaxID=1169539 RepID=A0A0G4EHV4_VITBC|nr:unnamed protein product [Vitrella brassicaformis CCMP3155]|eukprot:CEL96588.1 unnamed protein product [Vitrella brassicaformis CCMP3155]
MTAGDMTVVDWRQLNEIVAALDRQNVHLRRQLLNKWAVAITDSVVHQDSQHRRKRQQREGHHDDEAILGFFKRLQHLGYQSDPLLRIVVAKAAPLVGQGSLGLHAAMELLRTSALFRVMDEDFFHAVMTRLTGELRKARSADGLKGTQGGYPVAFLLLACADLVFNLSKMLGKGASLRKRMVKGLREMAELQEEGGEVLEWLEQTGTSLAGGYGEADVGLQELTMVLTGLLEVRWRDDSILEVTNDMVERCLYRGDHIDPRALTSILLSLTKFRCPVQPLLATIDQALAHSTSSSHHSPYGTALPPLSLSHYSDQALANLAYAVAKGSSGNYGHRRRPLFPNIWRAISDEVLDRLPALDPPSLHGQSGRLQPPSDRQQAVERYAEWVDGEALWASGVGMTHRDAARDEMGENQVCSEDDEETEDEEVWLMQGEEIGVVREDLPEPRRPPRDDTEVFLDGSIPSAPPHPHTSPLYALPEQDMEPIQGNSLSVILYSMSEAHIDPHFCQRALAALSHPRILHTLTPVDIACLLRALAAMQFRSLSFLERIAEFLSGGSRNQCRLEEYGTHQLAQMVLALGQMRFHHEGLLSALVLVLAEKLGECGPRRLTMIARGLQSLRYGPAAFLDALTASFSRPGSMSKLDLTAVECLLDYLSTISHPVPHKAFFTETAAFLTQRRSSVDPIHLQRLESTLTVLQEAADQHMSQHQYRCMERERGGREVRWFATSGRGRSRTSASPRKSIQTLLQV